MAGAPRLLDRLDGEDAEHFAEVRALLDAADVPYEVDPTLVRGLDYYTRTVFEFESAALGAQSGVGGGGRYDGLVEELGGPPTPGCGWAAGIERILLASDDAAGAVSGPPTPAPPVDLFVAFADRGAARRRLRARRRGAPRRPRRADRARGRSLKGQLKQADRLGARFVAILSEEGAALKDMESGEQRDVEPAAVLREVLRGRGPE